jgi:hypothetical protein
MRIDVLFIMMKCLHPLRALDRSKEFQTNQQNHKTNVDYKR